MLDNKNLTLDELIDIHKATVNTIEGVFKKEHLEFDDRCLDQITFRDYWVARHTIEHLEKLRELKSTMGSDTYYIIPKNGTWIVNGVNILDKIKEAMDEAQGVRVMKETKRDLDHISIHTGKDLLDSGIVKFEVLNGAWIGEIKEDDTIYCKDYSETVIGTIILKDDLILDLLVRPLSYKKEGE